MPNRLFVWLSLRRPRRGGDPRTPTDLHRRFGQIIQMMKKAGVVNPVFLSTKSDDAMDFGDPSSALLYVGSRAEPRSSITTRREYDLSKVMFIANRQMRT